MGITYTIVTFISWLANVFEWMIILRAVLSFFPMDIGTGVWKIYRAMVSVTEPIVSPSRRIIERFVGNTGYFDFSLLLALILIRVVRRIAIMLVFALM